MNSSSNQDQSLPQLKPDFKHRFTYRDCESEATPEDLDLAVSLILTRANAVLNMVKGEFTGEDARSRTSDHILYFSLESVSKDLEDMKQIVKAYCQANQKQESSKEGV